MTFLYKYGSVAPIAREDSMSSITCVAGKFLHTRVYGPNIAADKYQSFFRGGGSTDNDNRRLYPRFILGHDPNTHNAGIILEDMRPLFLGNDLEDTLEHYTDIGSESEWEFWHFVRIICFSVDQGLMSRLVGERLRAQYPGRIIVLFPRDEQQDLVEYLEGWGISCSDFSELSDFFQRRTQERDNAYLVARFSAEHIPNSARIAVIAGIILTKRPHLAIYYL
jgi:hypothetical protein